MSKYFEKFSTLAVNCLSSFLALSVVGCATSAKKNAALDLEVKARVMRLETELSRKNEVIGRLEAKLNKKPRPVPPKAAFHPVAKPPPIKTEKLRPEAEIFDDDSLETVVGGGEESISDSSQEILHFYYLGYQHLTERKFENAIRSLEHFLDENPTHVYADRAQYLIAEANCGSKEFHLCLLSANALESRYPYSLKIPDAISLKIVALQNLGQSEEAAKTLARLNRTYPDRPKAKTPPPLMEDTDE